MHIFIESFLSLNTKHLWALSYIGNVIQISTSAANDSVSRVGFHRVLRFPLSFIPGILVLRYHCTYCMCNHVAPI